MERILLFLLGLVVIGSSGCETVSSQQRREHEAAVMHDIANLKADIARINARLDGIEAGREDVYSQISLSQQKMSKSEAQYRAEIAALQSRLASEAAAREKMKQEMVADLSSKIEKIIKSQTRGSAFGVSGVEHVVKPGQTLSAIAKAYGVKTKDIIKANRLKNPDDLRVGQRIIIPD